ncbi:hypothetical protein A3D03_03010 [Candidatus Gottesmanbacteria bacterium RIFCSPHIGHO2_02_FULL_40_13]|uniref:Dockerin domain-containing protein n=1 Tax=Candidatus Gottesmanbacteria bacterium RIFCSPHIGHO2_02_FULL_40_13 TaxID=1798384 RepID=A0A1F6AA13_9BACT|nr:MAG: hypothetical protein A3D03_03010 [Candidatus Gottesmanbacteria bacterium RIFCSPHIGHO2_02_FULL_40_13]
MSFKKILVYLFLFGGVFVFPFLFQKSNDVQAFGCTDCTVNGECYYYKPFNKCIESTICDKPLNCSPQITGTQECYTCDDWPGGWCTSGHQDCVKENKETACGNNGVCQDSDNNHECGCFGEDEEELTPTPTLTPIPTLTGGPTAPVGGEVETRQNQVLYMNSTPLSTPIYYSQEKSLGTTGDYVLSASVLTFVSPSTGSVKVGLYDEGGTLIGNALEFPLSADYVTKQVTLNISSAADVSARIYANGGAEADFDFVSLKKQGNGVLGDELLANNQFDTVELTPLSKAQPDGWGAGEGNWGYVWGVVNPNFAGRSVLFMNSSSRNRYQSDGNFSWMRYETGVGLSPGTYQIKAIAYAPRLSSLTGGRVVQIAVACGMVGNCPGSDGTLSIPVNQFIGSIDITNTSGFSDPLESQNFTIYGTDVSNYTFRIFANDGSEVLVDSLRIDRIDPPENIVSEEFGNTSPQTSTVALPYNWTPYNYADLYSVVSSRFDVYASDPYIIPIGSKDSVTVTIGTGGTGNEPQIKYTAKLSGAEGHPDMYFKLRAIDDLAFLSNPASGPTCESPGAGGVDLYVPMTADSFGVYTPVTSINVPSPSGGTVATVADGWVILTGMSAGKYYTLNLKAPKTRGTEMIEHALLSGGQNANQNYDWTGNALQPGDLPDPNNSNKQDCTVNSVDISLINSRLGNTDDDSLNIADVSYDGVVNANDIAQVVGTLSTKPDDDN